MALGYAINHLDEIGALLVPSHHHGREDEEGRHVPRGNLPFFQGQIVTVTQEFLNLHQIVSKAARRVIAVGYVLRCAFLYNPANHVGYVHSDGRHVWYPAAEYTLHDVQRRISVKDRLVSQECPEHDTKGVDIGPRVGLGRHAARLLGTNVTQLVVGTQLLGERRPSGAGQAMLEGTEAGSIGDELDFAGLHIVVESIAADLAMDDALAVVYHLQTFRGADGKIHEVLQADRGQGLEAVVRRGHPSVVLLVRPEEGRAQVDRTEHVVGAGELVDADNDGSFVTRKWAEADEVEGKRDVVSLRIRRRRQALGDMEAPLLAEDMIRNPSHHLLLYYGGDIAVA